MPTPTKYTYSIYNDFPYHIVATDRLSQEIENSTIVIALDYINTSGDICDIWFKDILSSGDQTTLNAIVAAHTGTPLPSDALEVKFTQTSNVTLGYTNSSGSNLTVIRATAYLQQTTNAQRSLLSNNANDTLLGTGAQKIKITYYDQDLAGPYSEIVSMNGTTYVTTVSSNICFVEKIETVSVGSQLSNVGTIYLKVNNTGNGANIGTIPAGDGVTNWCHHYVANNKTMNLISLIGSIKGQNNGALEVHCTIPTDSSIPETTIAPKLRIACGKTDKLSFDVPIIVVGPAMVTVYGRSDASSGNLDWSVGMGYYED